MTSLVKNISLSHANCYTSIGNEVFVGSFISKIILGSTDYDETSQVKFDPKSLIISSDKFFNFVDVIGQAHNAYKTQSTEPFQKVISQTNPLYQLVGYYQEHEGQWRFQLRVVWYHKKDKKFLQALEKGEKEPINSEEDFVYLTRGYVLSEDQVDQLYYQMSSILEHTFIDHNNARADIKDLIDYVTHKNDQLRKVILEKMKDYGTMSHCEKLEMLEDIIKTMKTNCKNLATVEEVKAFTNKLMPQTNLIFALIHHNLN